MTKSLSLAALFLICSTSQIFAQTTEALRQTIQTIVATKNATVGVAIMDKNGKDTLFLNGEQHFPMQSVFKFHIALALLSEIDRGKFSLKQKISIKGKDLLPGLYSPIREKYPEGANLTIAEVIEYTVSQSDNAGCDALLRLLGGPHVVERYFAKNNFTDIAIKINEETMQNNWDLQFQNWTTPKAANHVLASFYGNKNKFLSAKSHSFIWKVMKQTETGKDRLKGQLPSGTVVAHKTGWSGANKDGITAAVNDIGIVFLPNGQHFFISVFVTNSKEDFKTNEKIIADVAKAAWDYFVSRKN
ncbi:MAG: class A beta-lactamase, subclass A2 [Candidatus Kapaibacterium sp.]|nr:MAG: class A beta-lactamase, subclass A2 [Candidatus Kapabacteria bacterium]